MTKLDTRQKIRSAGSIENLSREFGTHAVMVHTAMDPLTLAHARRLKELAGPEGRAVVVLLADPPEPLLPQGARAELAAALDCVTAVVTGLDPARLAEVPPSCLVDEQAPDLERRHSLIESVHHRHSATS